MLAILLVVIAPAAASADDPVAAEPQPPPSSELRWNEDWPRFRPAEYVVTGVVGAGAITEYILLPGQRTPHWTTTNAFDDSIRNTLRLRSASALSISWTAADVVGVSVVVLAIGVDSLLVPLFRGSTDVALQVTMMGLQSYALSSILSITLYDTVGRARPSYADCQRDSHANADCNISPTDSFPSGHTNEAFTAAGHSCVSHMNLPLYGSKLADALACSRDIGLASADGVLRILGDRHYATDVLTGAAIGFSFGFGLPMLLHYQGGERADRSPLAKLSVSPMLGAGVYGLVAGSRF